MKLTQKKSTQLIALIGIFMIMALAVGLAKADEEEEKMDKYRKTMEGILNEDLRYIFDGESRSLNGLSTPNGALRFKESNGSATLSREVVYEPANAPMLRTTTANKYLLELDKDALGKAMRRWYESDIDYAERRQSLNDWYWPGMAGLSIFTGILTVVILDALHYPAWTFLFGFTPAVILFALVPLIYYLSKIGNDVEDSIDDVVDAQPEELSYIHKAASSVREEPFCSSCGPNGCPKDGVSSQQCPVGPAGPVEQENLYR